MTKEEVEKHLRGIGTTDAKKQYIDDILKRAGYPHPGENPNPGSILRTVEGKPSERITYVPHDITEDHNSKLIDKKTARSLYEAYAKLEEKKPDRNSDYIRWRPRKSYELNEAYPHGKLMSIYEQLGSSREEAIQKVEKLIREKESRGLVKALGTTTAIGLIGGIFFLSSNVTGNVISSLTTKTTSFIGAGLLIIGLVAGFFWMKARKKK